MDSIPTSWISAEDYLALEEQDEPRVESFRRHGESGWFYTRVEDWDGSIKLESIAVELKLQEIYLDTHLGDR